MLFFNTASCIRRAWAVQLLWLIQMSILWWTLVHPWSVPVNASQARNNTSQKVACPSEAVFCFISSLCVRWWTMRHYLELRCPHPLLEAADVIVKLRMYDSSSVFRRLTTWDPQVVPRTTEDLVLSLELSSVKPTSHRADTSSTQNR